MAGCAGVDISPVRWPGGCGSLPLSGAGRPWAGPGGLSAARVELFVELAQVVGGADQQSFGLACRNGCVRGVPPMIGFSV